MKFLFLSVGILMLFSLSGCSPKNAGTGKPVVTVTVLPQKFFVDRIAGDWLDVNVMVPPGGNHHTYEPTPMQMKSLSKSSAYYMLGDLSFETAWMDKMVSVSPGMKVVNTSVGCELLTDDVACGEDAEHQEHHEHHEANNPHIWLSPKLVKMQAVAIYNSLATLFPEHQKPMEQNLNRFLGQCDSVHFHLDSVLSNFKGTAFIVYHPVWTYMAHEYQLEQVAIEHNGKEATADKLKNIIDYANEHNIRYIFVQKEFNDTQARAIADQINGRVISLNPLDYNWFNIMNEFGEAFQYINK